VIASALEHYRARDFSTARAEFERAHALDPGARTLRGIGLCAYYEDDFVRAALSFEQALSEARHPLDDEQRGQTLELLARVHRRIAQLRVRAEPPQAAILVDGAPIENDRRVPMPPGRYRLEVRLTGHDTHVQTFEVAAGEQMNLSVELAIAATPAVVLAPPPAVSPAPSPPYAAPWRADEPAPDARLAPWIAASATLALAAAAAGFALAGNAELEEVRQACRRAGCTDAKRQELWNASPIETYEVLTNVAIAASAAGLTTTVTLFLLTASETPETEPRGRRARTVGMLLVGRL
jgi:hypothetical protein